MKKGKEIMLTDSMEGFQGKAINYHDYEVSFRRWLVIQIDSGNITCQEAWKAVGTDADEERGAEHDDWYCRKRLQTWNQKKVWTQTGDVLARMYPMVSKAVLCELFGFTRQAWYDSKKRQSGNQVCQKVLKTSVPGMFYLTLIFKFIINYLRQSSFS